MSTQTPSDKILGRIYGKKRGWVFTPAHFRDLGNDLGIRKALQITRFRGLGEMNPAEPRQPTLDPENRTLLEVTMEDVSAAVQRHVEEAGFSVVRDLVGHGIGRELHEEPSVPNFGTPGRGPLLKEGMVLAIEPMVNAGQYHVELGEDGWTVRTRDGRPSAHFEHTVAVTAQGAEVLTRYGETGSD